MRDRTRHRHREDRGNATVLVIMVPFILVSMMLVVQFGLAYYGRQVLAGAAQDGAAIAALEGSSDAEGLNVARGLIRDGGGGWITSPSVTASRGGGVVTFTARGTAISLVPLIPRITISATSSAVIEEFTPQGGTP